MFAKGHRARKPAVSGAALAVLLALVACGPASAPGATGGARYEYVRPAVSISHLPKLNEPFIVTGKATAIKEDLPDVDLWLGVSGAVYLDGEDRWHGPLKLGEEKIITATFAFVTEGNHDVAAYTNPAPPRWERYMVSVPGISVHVTSNESKWGWVVDNPGCCALSWGPGNPPHALAGHTIVVDTALALNQADQPRIEFLQSWEDVKRLQAEGLIPTELRYQWWWLGRFEKGGEGAGFDQYFVLAFFDALRPEPRHLVAYEGDLFHLEDGVLKGNYRAYTVPIELGRAKKAVSPVELRAIAWRDKTEEDPTTLAYRGIQRFEFTLDGQPLTPVTADLKRPEESKAQ